jgi:hypothetical protein
VTLFPTVNDSAYYESGSTLPTGNLPLNIKLKGAYTIKLFTSVSIALVNKLVCLTLSATSTVGLYLQENLGHSRLRLHKSCSIGGTTRSAPLGAPNGAPSEEAPQELLHLEAYSGLH